MGWLRETRELSLPRVVELPRVTDRISFLHLDRVVIRQDETGVIAVSRNQEVRIPIAANLVLFCGSGTSITQPAVLTLSRHGTTVVWVGDAAAGVSATVRPLTSSSRLAELQASLWADPAARRDVARAMFLHRFGDATIGDDVSLDELRGMEGRRVRDLYSESKRRFGLFDWRREHDGTDPVNVAMNVANGMLYGVAGAVVNALGLSPALGFVHSGNARAFVLDIADLYKAETSVPTAFACHGSRAPADDARRSMREYLAGLRIHAAMVRDILRLLEAGSADSADEDRNDLIAVEGVVHGDGWNQADR